MVCVTDFVMTFLKSLKNKNQELESIVQMKEVEELVYLELFYFIFILFIPTDKDPYR